MAYSIALCTSDPSVNGLDASEAKFDGYVRAVLPEIVAPFENDGIISFGKCSGGDETITHIAVIGEDVAVLPLAMPISVKNGVSPLFPVGFLAIR